MDASIHREPRVVSKPKEESSSLNMILATIVLLLVIGAGYYYYKIKSASGPQRPPGGRQIDSSANAGLGGPDPEGSYAGVSIDTENN